MPLPLYRWSERDLAAAVEWLRKESGLDEATVALVADAVRGFS